ncbi:MAG: type II toxin-antitoxin system HicA family toxin [Desulfamplus sp.]|nr:type II toxin-antitoxin system HicA family toxin [Desulfamplus sp.]
MITKFPSDVPITDVLKTLNQLGFRILRIGNHISMIRENENETSTPLTIPNHKTLKGSTLRTILTQSGIKRNEFLDAYEQHKK